MNAIEELHDRLPIKSNSKFIFKKFILKFHNTIKLYYFLLDTEYYQGIFKEVESTFTSLTGLIEVKKAFLRMAKSQIHYARKQYLGFNTSPTTMPHMVFMGGPGTGKTTVGRMVAGNL